MLVVCCCCLLCCSAIYSHNASLRSLFSFSSLRRLVVVDRALRERERGMAGVLQWSQAHDWWIASFLLFVSVFRFVFLKCSICESFNYVWALIVSMITHKQNLIRSTDLSRTDTTHSFIVLHSFIHSFIHSFTHSFITSTIYRSAMGTTASICSPCQGWMKARRYKEGQLSN